MHTIDEIIARIGIVPVIKITTAEQAIPLGKALLDGGLPIAEVTFRTAAGVEGIRILRTELPELLVGAGTIVNVEDARRAEEAGAQFIVCPGYSAEIVDYCQKQGLPVYPGVNNSSQLQQAIQQNLNVVKFFPAEASGGIPMLDALSAPFPSMKFMPTGGIGIHNLATYIKKPYIVACGGSWMVASSLVEQGRWDEISRLCREAVFAVPGFSFAHLGINGKDEQDSTEIAHLLGVLLQPVTNGNKSFFASSSIEITKRPFPGEHGHIGIRTWDIERALAFLEQYGFSGDESTANRNEEGKLTVIYLKPQIGGFAIHLLRSN